MAYVALSRHSNCIWCAFMIINSCWQFFQSEQTFSMSFHLNYSSIGETRGTPFRPSTPSFPSGRPQLAKRATLTKSSVENGFEILPFASKVSFTREIWSVVMSKTDPDPLCKRCYSTGIVAMAVSHDKVRSTKNLHWNSRTPEYVDGTFFIQERLKQLWFWLPTIWSSNYSNRNKL